jgi:hypothetical protein
VDGGGNGFGDGEEDLSGDSGGWGLRARGRRVMPALGGAAAVTVFVAGMAVFGTRLLRDDSGRGADGAAADETGGPDSTSGEGGSSGSASDSDSRDGRKGTSDRTTTTVAGDDDRRSPDEDRQRIESVPRRGDSAAGFGSVSGSGSGSGSGTGSGSTTETTTGRRSTTTTRPATTTTTAPDSPPLASWSVGWSAGSGSSGTLRATVQSASGSGGVDTRSVVLTITLSGGAHVASLDEHCSGSGPVTCTVPAPSAGDATTVSIGVTVDGPGETASVSARQGGSSLGSHPVDLIVAETTGATA